MSLARRRVLSQGDFRQKATLFRQAWFTGSAYKREGSTAGYVITVRLRAPQVPYTWAGHYGPAGAATLLTVFSQSLDADAIFRGGNAVTGMRKDIVGCAPHELVA